MGMVVSPAVDSSCWILAWVASMTWRFSPTAKSWGWASTRTATATFSSIALTPTVWMTAPSGSMACTGVGFGATEQGTDLALLPDGRILGFGMRGNAGTGPFTHLALTRLWPNGTLDLGGQQTHAIVAGATYPPGSKEFARALAVQSDGKLLVAHQLSNPADTRSDAFLTRFFPTGQVDPSFGAQGSSFAFSGLVNAARAIAIQPDGKIIIAGHTQADGSTMDFLIARFHPTGTVDNQFGDAFGIKTVPFGSGYDAASALALTPDGKIVVVGSATIGNRLVGSVLRLTNTGQPDTSFGPNHDGKVLVNFDDTSFLNSVIVQPDGKIVVGGYYNGDFFLQRLLVSGQPDPSFGVNGSGYNLTDMGGLDTLTALALAPNGWMYAADHTLSIEGTSDMALAQYTPNGLLAQCPSGQTCNHWSQGKLFINLSDSDAALALALREDNQIVVVSCADAHMAAAQVSTSEANGVIRPFQTNFAGGTNCAYGVQFIGANKDKLVLA